MLSMAFSMIRMDSYWDSIEKVKGEYDFTSYHNLLKDLTEYKITPYWILDYGNDLYDDGDFPHSDEAISAFVNFVLDAMENFKGNYIIWEVRRSSTFCC